MLTEHFIIIMERLVQLLSKYALFED